ncbi:MAG: 2Fe-2S iron-sulfur cluster binding domain-containing protein [Lewinellaceae bacterium]|nr:2Fe-2S iron-sulfur cluster binding domain-containing protein [Lewinellaceae bacterium]
MSNTQIYLCAPVALMRMAQMTLGMLDFSKENIHQETFIPERQQPLRTIDPSQTHHIVVTSPAGARTEFDIFAGETILNGALRQGIDLPYTCKTGVCLSCLARCVRGVLEIQFVEQTRREGPGALVNTCIGYAVSPEVELVYE